MPSLLSEKMSNTAEAQKTQIHVLVPFESSNSFLRRSTLARFSLYASILAIGATPIIGRAGEMESFRAALQTVNRAGDFGELLPITSDCP